MLSALVGFAAAGESPAAAPTSQPTIGELRASSGTVRLEISCRPEIRDEFQTALALVHSFFYDEARRRFHELSLRDPDCAMTWWGTAMTLYHPLWASPNDDEMAAGRDAVAKARAIGGTTDLERGLIDAIDAYFGSDEQPVVTAEAAQSCHGPRDHGARAGAFREAFHGLHRRFPDNLEVTVFYTLSLLGTAPPTDTAYANQLMATAILEPLFERFPDHPGIPHYIIHAYDYPALATRGLIAARQYGDIAPWVPHALHMPSHIYTRLGMWHDSIASNRASADAARQYMAKIAATATSYDELHALDYLEFAFLQTAQDREARALVDYVRGLKQFHEPNFAAAYALGAVPARYALETRRWDEAAALGAVHAEVTDRFPFAAAHIEFARAVGGARSGRLEVARRAVQRLTELRDARTEASFNYWANQIEIQRLAASAWLAHAERHHDEALEFARQAVTAEMTAGTHPVTPGQILPAAEQLGDLLMELGRPAEALEAYETSLEAFPRRFNGHLGAASAAAQAGKPDVARAHYERLLELAADGDGRREALERARAFVTGIASAK